MNPVVFHRRGTAAELAEEVPTNFRQIPVSELEPGLDTQLVYIKVKVTKKFPLVRLKNKPALQKIYAKEVNENCSAENQDAGEIPIYFMCEVGEKCQAIDVNDLIILSGFLVEKNTHPAPGRHKCQIKLDIYQKAYIWIASKTKETNAIPVRRRNVSMEPVPSTSASGSDQETSTAVVVAIPDDNATIPASGPSRPARSQAAHPQSSQIRPQAPAASPVRPQAPAASPVRPQAPAASPVRPQAPAASPVRPPAPAASPVRPFAFGSPVRPQTAQDSVTSPKRQNLTLVPGKGQRDYSYTKLKNLKQNTLVNIFGVVKFFKPISKTRGTDYYMSMSITDPSLEEADSQFSKLRCVLFARDASNLPQITQVGDIVRLHRLSISTYQGDLQGQTGPGFSCVIFDGTVGGTLTPISSTKTYTITKEDLEKVEELRQWSETSDLLLDTQIQSNYDTFSDMQAGKYYNIVCQVVAISEVQPDLHFLFKCWDGTTCQHAVHEVDIEALNNEAFLREDKDLMATAAGFLYDVSIFDDHCESASNVAVGDFVKFINLHAMIHKDPNVGSVYATVPTVEICLHRGTNYGRKLAILDHTDPAARKIQAKLDVIAEQRRLAQEQAQQQQLQMLQQQQQSGHVVPDVIVTDEGAMTTGPEAAASKITTTEPVPSTSGITRKRTLVDLNRSREEDEVEEERLQSLRTPQSDVSPRRSPRRPAAGVLDSAIQMREEIIGPSPKAKRSRKSGISLSKKTSANPTAGTSTDLPQCLQKTATVVLGHHNVEPVTIKDIISDSMPTISKKFRLKAKVIKFHPRVTKVQDFLHLYCFKCNYLSMIPISGGATLNEHMNDWCRTAQPDLEDDGIPYFVCPKCPRKTPRKRHNKEAMLQYIIAVKFILEDDTGSLLAQIWKENAIEFFDKVQPLQLLKKGRLFRRMMKELEKVCIATDENAVMDCCVQSYSTPVGVCYQIFNTVLSCDLQ